MYPTLTDASLCRLAKLGGDPFELEVLYAVASLSQSCCWNTQRGVGGWGGSLNNHLEYISFMVYGIRTP